MGRGKIFECGVTVSTAVKEKLFKKHGIEIWEVEEVIYDDPNAFALAYKDCYFIYGRTFSGRFLIALVRVLQSAEVKALGFSPTDRMLKIITARQMNQKQKREYTRRKGPR